MLKAVIDLAIVLSGPLPETSRYSSKAATYTPPQTVVKPDDYYITFSIVIQAFNRVCVEMDIDRVTEQRVYQALLLMSSDNEENLTWLEKANQPENYLPDYAKRAITKRLPSDVSPLRTSSRFAGASSSSSSSSSPNRMLPTRFQHEESPAVKHSYSTQAHDAEPPVPMVAISHAQLAYNHRYRSPSGSPSFRMSPSPYHTSGSAGGGGSGSDSRGSREKSYHELSPYNGGDYSVLSMTGTNGNMSHSFRTRGGVSLKATTTVEQQVSSFRGANETDAYRSSSKIDDTGAPLNSSGNRDFVTGRLFEQDMQRDRDRRAFAGLPGTDRDHTSSPSTASGVTLTGSGPKVLSHAKRSSNIAGYAAGDEGLELSSLLNADRMDSLGNTGSHLMQEEARARVRKTLHTRGYGVSDYNASRDPRGNAGYDYSRTHNYTNQFGNNNAGTGRREREQYPSSFSDRREDVDVSGTPATARSGAANTYEDLSPHPYAHNPSTPLSSALHMSDLDPNTEGKSKVGKGSGGNRNGNASDKQSDSAHIYALPKPPPQTNPINANRVSSTYDGRVPNDYIQHTGTQYIMEGAMSIHALAHASVLERAAQVAQIAELAFANPLSNMTAREMLALRRKQEGTVRSPVAVVPVSSYTLPLELRQAAVPMNMMTVLMKGRPEIAACRLQRWYREMFKRQLASVQSPAASPTASAAVASSSTDFSTVMGEIGSHSREYLTSMHLVHNVHDRDSTEDNHQPVSVLQFADAIEKEVTVAVPVPVPVSVSVSVPVPAPDVDSDDDIVTTLNAKTPPKTKEVKNKGKSSVFSVVSSERTHLSPDQKSSTKSSSVIASKPAGDKTAQVEMEIEMDRLSDAENSTAADASESEEEEYVDDFERFSPNEFRDRDDDDQDIARDGGATRVGNISGSAGEGGATDAKNDSGKVTSSASESNSGDTETELEEEHHSDDEWSKSLLVLQASLPAKPQSREHILRATSIKLSHAAHKKHKDDSKEWKQRLKVEMEEQLREKDREAQHKFDLLKLESQRESQERIDKAALVLAARMAEVEEHEKAISEHERVQEQAALEKELANKESQRVIKEMRRKKEETIRKDEKLLYETDIAAEKAKMVVQKEKEAELQRQLLKLKEAADVTARRHEQEDILHQEHQQRLEAEAALVEFEREKKHAADVLKAQEETKTLYEKLEKQHLAEMRTRAAAEAERLVREHEQQVASIIRADAERAQRAVGEREAERKALKAEAAMQLEQSRLEFAKHEKDIQKHERDLRIHAEDEAKKQAAAYAVIGKLRAKHVLAKEQADKDAHEREIALEQDKLLVEAAKREAMEIKMQEMQERMDQLRVEGELRAKKVQEESVAKETHLTARIREAENHARELEKHEKELAEAAKEAKEARIAAEATQRASMAFLAKAKAIQVEEHEEHLRADHQAKIAEEEAKVEEERQRVKEIESKLREMEKRMHDMHLQSHIHDLEIQAIRDAEKAEADEVLRKQDEALREERQRLTEKFQSDISAHDASLKKKQQALEEHAKQQEAAVKTGVMLINKLRNKRALAATVSQKAVHDQELAVAHAKVKEEENKRAAIKLEVLALRSKLDTARSEADAHLIEERRLIAERHANHLAQQRVLMEANSADIRKMLAEQMVLHRDHSLKMFKLGLEKQTQIQSDTQLAEIGLAIAEENANLEQILLKRRSLESELESMQCHIHALQEESEEHIRAGKLEDIERLRLEEDTYFSRLREKEHEMSIVFALKVVNVAKSALTSSKLRSRQESSSSSPREKASFEKKIEEERLKIESEEASREALEKEVLEMQANMFTIQNRKEERVQEEGKWTSNKLVSETTGLIAALRDQISIARKYAAQRQLHFVSSLTIISKFKAAHANAKSVADRESFATQLVEEQYKLAEAAEAKEHFQRQIASLQTKLDDIYHRSKKHFDNERTRVTEALQRLDMESRAIIAEKSEALSAMLQHESDKQEKEDISSVSSSSSAGGVSDKSFDDEVDNTVADASKRKFLTAGIANTEDNLHFCGERSWAYLLQLHENFVVISEGTEVCLQEYKQLEMEQLSEDADARIAALQECINTTSKDMSSNQLNLHESMLVLAQLKAGFNHEYGVAEETEHVCAVKAEEGKIASYKDQLLLVERELSRLSQPLADIGFKAEMYWQHESERQELSVTDQETRLHLLLSDKETAQRYLLENEKCVQFSTEIVAQLRAQQAKSVSVLERQRLQEEISAEEGKVNAEVARRKSFSDNFRIMSCKIEVVRNQSIAHLSVLEKKVIGIRKCVNENLWKARSIHINNIAEQTGKLSALLAIKMQDLQTQFTANEEQLAAALNVLSNLQVDADESQVAESNALILAANTELQSRRTAENEVRLLREQLQQLWGETENIMEAERNRIKDLITAHDSRIKILIDGKQKEAELLSKDEDEKIASYCAIIAELREKDISTTDNYTTKQLQHDCRISREEMKISSELAHIARTHEEIGSLNTQLASIREQLEAQISTISSQLSIMHDDIEARLHEEHHLEHERLRKEVDFTSKVAAAKELELRKQIERENNERQISIDLIQKLKNEKAVAVHEAERRKYLKEIEQVEARVAAEADKRAEAEKQASDLKRSMEASSLKSEQALQLQRKDAANRLAREAQKHSQDLARKEEEMTQLLKSIAKKRNASATALTSLQRLRDSVHTVHLVAAKEKEIKHKETELAVELAHSKKLGEELQGSRNQLGKVLEKSEALAHDEHERVSGMLQREGDRITDALHIETQKFSAAAEALSIQEHMSAKEIVSHKETLGKASTTTSHRLDIERKVAAEERKLLALTNKRHSLDEELSKMRSHLPNLSVVAEEHLREMQMKVEEIRAHSAAMLESEKLNQQKREHALKEQLKDEQMRNERSKDFIDKLRSAQVKTEGELEDERLREKDLENKLHAVEDSAAAAQSKVQSLTAALVSTQEKDKELKKELENEKEKGTKKLTHNDEAFEKDRFSPFSPMPNHTAREGDNNVVPSSPFTPGNVSPIQVSSNVSNIANRSKNIFTNLRPITPQQGPGGSFSVSPMVHKSRQWAKSNGAHERHTIHNFKEVVDFAISANVHSAGSDSVIVANKKSMATALSLLEKWLIYRRTIQTSHYETYLRKQRSKRHAKDHGSGGGIRGLKNQQNRGGGGGSDDDSSSDSDNENPNHFDNMVYDDGEKRYDWDIDENRVPLPKKNKISKIKDGYTQHSQSAALMMYCHMLSPAVIKDVYLQSQYERWLRSTMVNICMTHAMRDIYHAWATCTYVNCSHESRLHYLKILVRHGFILFAANVLRPTLRLKAVNKFKAITFFFDDAPVGYTPENGRKRVNVSPMARKVQSERGLFGGQLANIHGRSSSGSGTPLPFKTPVPAHPRNRLYFHLHPTSLTSTGYDLEGGDGRSPLTVCTPQSLQYRSVLFSPNTTQGTGATYAKSFYASSKREASPNTVHKNDPLDLTGSYKKLSSAKFYTIALIGRGRIYDHNVNLLCLLFAMRRLFKRTVYEARVRQIQELAALTMTRRTYQVMKSHRAAMVANQDAFQLKAEQHCHVVQQRAIRFALERFVYFPTLLRREAQLLQLIRARIVQNPMALKALHLIRCSAFVKFFVAIQNNYHYSDITDEEIKLSERHKCHYALQTRLRRWVHWKRDVSDQRVNAKNYCHYRYILLKKRVQTRSERMMGLLRAGYSEEWVKDLILKTLRASFVDFKAFAVHVKNDAISTTINTASDMLPEGEMSSVRITVEECTNSVNRAWLMYGLVRLWKWASCRRVYYSLSDVVHSQCSDKDKKRRLGNELISAEAAAAKHYDNLSAVKLRLHLPISTSPSPPVQSITVWRHSLEMAAWVVPKQFLQEVFNIKVVGDVEVKVGVGHAHLNDTTHTHMPGSEETKNAAVLGSKAQQALARSANEKNREYEAEITNKFKQYSLPRLQASKLNSLVSFDSTDNSFNLVIRPVNSELVLLLKEGAAGRATVSDDVLVTVNGNVATPTRRGMDHPTLRRVDNLRRGLVRAKSRFEDENSSTSLSHLIHTMLPPSFIIGGELLLPPSAEVTDTSLHMYRGGSMLHSVERAHQEQSTAKLYNKLASGPILMVYTRRWIVTTRIGIRLRGISLKLRKKRADKLISKYWAALRSEFIANMWRRKHISLKYFSKLQYRSLSLISMKGAMARAQYVAKLTPLRRFIQNNTSLSFDALAEYRKFITAVRDRVNMVKQKAARHYESSIETSNFGAANFGDSPERRSIVRAQSETIEEKRLRFLKQRIMFVFFQSCGNRQGAEYSALENVFNGQRDGETGFEARLITLKTSLLVSKALNRHARIRLLYRRLLDRTRRNKRNKNTLVPVLFDEQKAAIQFLQYLVRCRHKFEQCRLNVAKRKVQYWRIRCVAARHSRGIKRETFRFMVERHEKIARISGFFVPFVDKVYIRRKSSAFHKWKTFYQTVLNRHDIVLVNMISRRQKNVLHFCKDWLRARKWAENRTLRFVFSAMKKHRAWAAKMFMTKRPFARFCTFLRGCIARRGISEREFLRGEQRRAVFSFRFMCRPPTLRFKHVLLNIAVKLRQHPICKHFFRMDMVDSQFRHLHHRRAESGSQNDLHDIALDKLTVRRGELLRCITKESLCFETIYWLKREEGSADFDVCMTATYYNENTKRALGSVIGVPGTGYSFGGAASAVGNVAGSGFGSSTPPKYKDEDNETPDHNFGYAPGLSLSSFRKEAAILANQIGIIGEAYINANCMYRSLYRWVEQHRYQIQLDQVVTINLRYKSKKKVTLQKLYFFSKSRALVRKNANNIIYLRVLNAIDHMKQCREDEEAMCNLGAAFHKEQRMRILLFFWHQKIMQRLSRKRRNNIANSFRDARGVSLALWLMRASCAVKPNFELPESHQQKIHYNDFDENDNNGYGGNNRKVSFGLTKREMRAEQRLKDKYRTPQKKTSDQHTPGTETKDKRKANFLALSIMRSPILKGM